MLVKLLGLTAACGFATIIWGDSPARSNLNGSWRLDPSHSEVHSHIPNELTWHIEQQDNSIHLIQSSQEKKNGAPLNPAGGDHVETSLRKPDDLAGGLRLLALRTRIAAGVPLIRWRPTLGIVSAATRGGRRKLTESASGRTSENAVLLS